MSKKFLSPVNLTNGATLPTSGSTGDLFFKSDDFKIYVHDGANWVVAQGSGGTGSTWQGAWDSMATYSPGDAVSFEGSSYVYISAIDGNSNPATTPVDWGILAEQGSPGIVWQGTWSSMNYYNVNDAVQYNGSAYINTSAGMSSTPPAALMGWSLLASKGTDGSAGINWRGEYDPMASYLSLDAVSYLGSSYVYKGIAFGNSTPEEGSSDWDVLAGGSTGGGGASVTVSDTAPATPSSGNLWYNSAIGISFIYYDSFWVEMSPAITGPAGPTGVIVSETAPTNTDQLWADPNAVGSYVVPANGSKGQVLAKVTDASYDTGWVTPQGSGNVIINGAFDVWQRGTSFGPGILNYTADRWLTELTANATVTRQTFTPGTAPVAGYEGQYYLRYVADVAGAVHGVTQRIEDVRTFAGQTVTLSFWAKANAATTMLINLNQYFGTGGSADAYVETTQALTTSWTRYTKTISIPSISGKTIGANNHLQVRLLNVLGATFTMELWGVQLESGSTATPFKRNAPSIQAELAACQRYYIRMSGSGGYAQYATGLAANSTTAYFPVPVPVQMRVNATSVEYLDLQVGDGVTYPAVTSGALSPATSLSTIGFNIGTSGMSTYRPYILSGRTLSSYLAFSAEL